MAYHRQQGVDTAIVRIFNTYGPRMRPHDGRAIPTFMRQALQDRPITVFGDGSQTRSFCYVSDLIDGIIRLAESGLHHPVNIGNPNEFTLLELAQRGDRGHRLALGDRPRGAPDRRPAGPPARHLARARDARLGAEGRAARRARAGRSRTSGVEALTGAGVPDRAGARGAVASGHAPMPQNRNRDTKARPAALMEQRSHLWLTHRTQIQDPPKRAARRRAARPSPSIVLPPVDVRRKRPPLLSFLLRMETLRRAVPRRLAAGAGLRRAVRRDLHGADGQGRAARRRLGVARLERRDAGHDRLRLPRDRAAVRPLGHVRRARAAPRPAADRHQPVPGDARRARLRASSTASSTRATTSSTGRWPSRSSTSASPRWLYERVTGVLLRAAGYRRRAVLVGSGKHIEDVAHALIDEVHAPVEMVGFISLTPRPDNGLRSLGRIDDLPEVLDAHRVQEVIIADPDFPEERAVELVDQCHRRGVTVRIAPSTMEILVHRAEFVPGASVPLFELRPPVFDGFDYLVKRTFDFSSRSLLLLAAQPAAAGDRDRRVRLLARAGALPLDPARASAASRSPASSSARCARTPTSCRPTSSRSTRPPAPLFKIRDDPRLTRVGRVPAPLLARRAAAAVQRDRRADVARRPAAAAAARLRPARGVAQEALPRAARA